MSAGKGWRRHMSSDEVIREIARRTNRIFLAFSCGKDSLAALIRVWDHFEYIIPVYNYDILGEDGKTLSFIEDTLTMVEDHFGIEVIRVPHSRYYTKLASATDQPPHNVPLLEACGFPMNWDMQTVMQEVMEDHGLDPGNEWTAVGTRAMDSANRRLAFQSFGPIRDGVKKFFPVWDLSKTQVVQIIEDEGLWLPVDYDIWGRSFDGMDYFFIEGVRRHFPEDWERIVAQFPLIEAEYVRKGIFDEMKASKASEVKR